MSKTAFSYSERIVPRPHDMIRPPPKISVMHDNAPPRVVARTMEEFEEISITPIHWPSYPPDLNTVQYIWEIMKDKVEHEYSTLCDGRRWSSY